MLAWDEVIRFENMGWSWTISSDSMYYHYVKNNTGIDLYFVPLESMIMQKKVLYTIALSKKLLAIH